jgi:hypothetical protein
MKQAAICAVHFSLLHDKNTSISSIASDILARCGRIISPLFEKMRSTGAEVAGTQNIASNNGFRRVYCSTSFDSGSASTSKSASFILLM